ncbi:hypothetical protein HFO04_34460 [Rhizobium laguerreae]|uniref:hypothetical protein n=1 Tax=Rhizobium laguerreae TaxID=1076926 RepID=UPI001C90C627|nr:hypothetical protein [Rhizobium laguerreae]MBY3246695.1 hypothetical protein [Rhizobium laguerreae]MBY3307820.1 hypothetical protein [Rhizobium laguerreae]MBY3314586.1 hypothetical protein [Rhizobium laguerreae]MBY3363274.1 hypothetical protein [Rhizobium laguerreae]
MEALEDEGLLSKEMLLAGDIPSAMGDGPNDDEEDVEIDHLADHVSLAAGREATDNRGPSTDSAMRPPTVRGDSIRLKPNLDVRDHLRVAGTGPTEIAKPFGFGRTSTLRC